MANVVKISGISDEMIALIDAKWKAEHFADRSEYVRELVRRDLATTKTKSLSEGVKAIFGTVHEQLAAYGLDESEIDSDVDKALAEVRSGRKKTRKAS